MLFIIDVVVRNLATGRNEKGDVIRFTISEKISSDLLLSCVQVWCDTILETDRVCGWFRERVLPASLPFSDKAKILSILLDKADPIAAHRRCVLIDLR